MAEPLLARVPVSDCGGNHRLARFTNEVADRLNALARTLQIELTGPGEYRVVPDLIDGSVAYAKIQDVSAASRVLGRGSAAGAGDVQELTLGGTLTMSGTALSVTTAAVSALTNNVTSGGSNDVVADFTDLTVYANDAATIRNDIYQLARKLKLVTDALRTIGIFT